jgi:hypothetical protein
MAPQSKGGEKIENNKPPNNAEVKGTRTHPKQITEHYQNKGMKNSDKKQTTKHH